MDPQLAAKLNNRKNVSEIDENINECIDDKFASKREIKTDEPTNELSNKLIKRKQSVEGEPSGNGDCAARPFKVFNPYTEFKEFSRKEIKNLESNFKKYDQDRDSYLGFEDLKYMMEKLGAAQTHLGLKQMIKEIDEDNDGKISFREFMLIFRKAKSGDFASGNPLLDLYEHYMQLESISVDEVGVSGAKSFFTARIQAQTRDQAAANEIIQEQQERKLAEEERKKRRQEFKAKQASFQN